MPFFYYNIVYSMCFPLFVLFVEWNVRSMITLFDATICFSIVVNQ